MKLGRTWGKSQGLEAWIMMKWMQGEGRRGREGKKQRYRKLNVKGGKKTKPAGEGCRQGGWRQRALFLWQGSDRQKRIGGIPLKLLLSSSKSFHASWTINRCYWGYLLKISQSKSSNHFSWDGDGGVGGMNVSTGKEEGRWRGKWTCMSSIAPGSPFRCLGWQLGMADVCGREVRFDLFLVA